MEILICVKAVPSKLLGKQYAGNSLFSINPYDAYSIKKMLELRKTIPCTVTCICMGPEGARDVLVRCLAMGADRAIHLCDPKFAGSDTFATSYILASAIGKLDYNLLVCGQMAVDGETGQVQYGLAERLNLICLPNVQGIQYQEEERFIIDYVNEEMLHRVQADTPLMISFDNLYEYSEVNLFALQQARKKEIIIWNANDLSLRPEECGLTGSKTKVCRSRQHHEQARETVTLCETRDGISAFLMNQIKIHQ
ncbi:electron transfer flavoprotein subunit beta/FixA family protein [Paenibacillus sp. GCM10012306]|uniref:electron transfer flavoprotein subunit beta/FixA family protein n=1 Tax=Paenibacillus sp. GCM10012306 TaxID=3317342 RepID=UPI003609D3FB